MRPTGVTRIETTGAGTLLSPNQECELAAVKALTTNQDIVTLGFVVDDLRPIEGDPVLVEGSPMKPGEQVVIECNNLNHLWLDGQAGDGVVWSLFEKRGIYATQEGQVQRYG